MAGPRRFQIPSLSEMEDGDTSTSIKNVEPAFKKFKESSSDAKTCQPSATQSTTLGRDADVSTTKPKGTLSAHEKRLATISREETLHQSSVVQNDNDWSKTSEAGTTKDDVQTAAEGADKTKGLASNKLGSSNCLIVNPRQRGNPILKSVRNIPWEYGNIVPDYLMGQSNCALFLSLRYHQLHPNYIHDRLKLLGRSYDLRVILVQVDVKEPHQILKELAKICILAECTMILAFSPEEAGRYLETYKIFENKPPEAIMEKTEDNFMAKFTDCMTRVKSVNKTDCSTLLTAFGSLANVIDANEEDLSLCPGFGPQKAKRLHNLFHEPFLRNPSAGKKMDIIPSLESQASSSTL